MKKLRCANWVFASIAWAQASFCGLSNFLGLESAWMISGLTWPMVAGLSVIISFITFLCGLVADDPAEKKAGILCGLISIAITLLFAVLMFSVFGTWFGSGALSGGC